VRGSRTAENTENVVLETTRSGAVLLSAVENRLARLVDSVVYDATTRRRREADGEQPRESPRRTRLEFRDPHHRYVGKTRSRNMTKAEMLMKNKRGATMVEYALLIIAIMVLAAVGYKNLGKQVKTNAEKSEQELK